MYCIFVAGIPAAGKSYFAEFLSQYLCVPMISKDQIKELLYDSIGFDSRGQKNQLNEVATEIIILFASHLMQSKSNLILENNFEKSSEKRITELLSQYNYKGITIILSCEFKIAFERFCERNKSNHRHPGHVINDYFPRKVSERDYQQISYYTYVDEIQKRGMDKFRVGESYINFDTTDINNFDWDTAVLHVGKLLSDLDELDKLY